MPVLSAPGKRDAPRIAGSEAGFIALVIGLSVFILASSLAIYLLARRTGPRYRAPSPSSPRTPGPPSSRASSRAAARCPRRPQTAQGRPRLGAGLGRRLGGGRGGPHARDLPRGARPRPRTRRALPPAARDGPVRPGALRVVLERQPRVRPAPAALHAQARLALDALHHPHLANLADRPPAQHVPRVHLGRALCRRHPPQRDRRQHPQPGPPLLHRLRRLHTDIRGRHKVHRG
ncbi:hypothetical protein B0H17DRAFT_1122779, partial [Mycena rosella]